VTRSLADWLALLRAELGTADDDARLQLTPAEERALLELARIAAHASERVAAPLTTFITGVALADLPPAQRLGRLRTMIDALEAEVPAPES
jgi:hypothetical protein